MRNKNKSKYIKDGTIVYARDEHFLDGKPKPDMLPGSSGRPTVVAASNRRDELALAKITSSERYQILQDMTKQRKKTSREKSSHINTHLETFDCCGNPIKAGEMFKVKMRNGRPVSISRDDFRVVQECVFCSSLQSHDNRNRVRMMKDKRPRKRPKKK